MSVDTNLECHPTIKKEAVDASVAETTPSAVTADSGLSRDQEAKVTETAGTPMHPAEAQGAGASRQLFGSGSEPVQMSGKTHVFQCGTEGGKVEVRKARCVPGARVGGRTGV